VSLRARTALFAASGAAFAGVLLYGLAGLPDFGHYLGPYGLVLDEHAVGERHVTNLPTAVNFDYRAIDTLGEEFILFAAALGMAVILRFRRGQEARAPERADELAQGTDVARVVGLALIGPLLLLGFYVVAHGHLTPGGGFQGGVILAAGLLLVFLAGELTTMRRLRPWTLIEVTESLGAAGYAAIGVAGLIGAGAFFANVLPLGPVGALQSGGTIPLANLAVSLEVTAAFVMVFSELLEQVLVVHR
jgi:multicomponent Na+:H+ antiporter subunit B